MPQEGQDTTAQAAPEAEPEVEESQEQESSAPESPEGIEALPSWAQDEIKELRKEAARRRVEAREAQVAAEKAEEEKLARERQFEELAQRRQAKIDELTPAAEQAGRLTELVRGQINEEIKDWPDSITAMAPAGEQPAEVWLEWLQKARPLVKELRQKSEPPAPGAGPRPSQNGSGVDDKTARQQWQSTFRAIKP